MGLVNNATKQYLSDNAVIADAFNFIIYQGQPIIQPDDLFDMDTVLTETYPNGKGSFEKNRDIMRIFSVKQDANAAYLLLGIESQKELHHAMPVRNMLYDALTYSRQVQKAAKRHRKAKDYKGHSAGEFLSGFYQDDRLIPVITLVILFSPEKWEAPLSLHEMLQPTKAEILSFVNDYQIHLLAPEHIDSIDLGKFHSSLREVLGFIKYSKDKNQLKSLMKRDKNFEHLSIEAVQVINACTGYDFQIENEKEEIDMCKAISDMRQESLEEGIFIGRSQGVPIGISQGISQAHIQQIMKKLAKKKSVETIADEIEQDVSYVENICKIITANPDANETDVYQILKNITLS